jgi:hypothetical protein
LAPTCAQCINEGSKQFSALETGMPGFVARPHKGSQVPDREAGISSQIYGYNYAKLSNKMSNNQAESDGQV